MRKGQGDLAAKKWHRGLSEASLLGEEAIAAAIIENPDLHDHVMKGLYEAELISRWRAFCSSVYVAIPRYVS